MSSFSLLFSCPVMPDCLRLHGLQHTRPPWPSPSPKFAQVHVHSVGDQLAAAESLQSCLTLCDPIDSSPPGSPVPGILQAGTLERVVISLAQHKSISLMVIYYSTSNCSCVSCFFLLPQIFQKCRFFLYILKLWKNGKINYFSVC